MNIWPPPALRGTAGKTLTGDIRAGLTLAAIALPGAMAAAQLAGVSPALGLLGFVIGAVVFALVGAHRTLSVGPDSTIAPMLAAGVAGAAAGGTSRGGDEDTAIILISLMVGALLIIVGVLRGGWITQFLSRPVTVGLLAGIGISIIVSQAGVISGVEDKTSGVVHEQWWQIWQQRMDINPWSVGLGLLVVVVVLVAGKISAKIPGALLGLAVAAVAAAWLEGAQLGGERGVDKLQSPESVWVLPDLAGIPWGAVWDLVPSALVITMLITVQTGATEVSTEQGNRTLDRDLTAIGVASLASAGAGSFALNASPPRTRLIQDVGGKTQIAALSAGLVVLLLLLFGTQLLPLLPEAGLAAVLVTIAASLIRVRELRNIARYSRVELLIALGTIIAVCELGVVQGVGIAALVTLLDRTRREARPPIHRKGLIPGSNHWVPINTGVDTVQVPGILVWSVEAPIWYADADYVLRELRHELNNGDYKVLILDGTAISDLDYTGVLAISTLIDRLASDNIPVLMSRPTRPMQTALRRAGLADEIRLHPTVSDAVKAGAELAGLELEFRAARAKKKDLAALEQEGAKRTELIDDLPPSPGAVSAPEADHRELD